MCAVSANLAGRLRGMVPHLDVKVVPNMVDTEVLQRPPFPSSDFAVCLLLRREYVQRKRFDVAIRAFAEAFADEAAVVLRIGGSGPEASSLVRLAEQLGVSDRVRFLGGLSRVQVRDEMRSADAFVLCSSVETFGVVVAEAQSVGELPAVRPSAGGRGEEIVVPVHGASCGA